MSTKIYQAYRTEIGNTQKSIDFLAEELYQKFKKDFMIIYDNNKTGEAILNAESLDKISVEEITKFLHLAENLNLSDHFGIRSMFDGEKDLYEIKIIVKAIKMWLASAYLLSPSCIFNGRKSIDIHFNETHCFLIPSDFLNGTEMPDYLEDYVYWNNTDKPDSISEEEWEERANTWKPLIEWDFYNAEIQVIDLKESYLSKNIGRLEREVLEDDNTMIFMCIEEVAKKIQDAWQKEREEKYANKEKS